MGSDPKFKETFATLRAVLRKHGKRLQPTADTADEFMLASPQLVDRAGRPLFVAGVQIRKNYVSYHLMPVYADPQLLKSLSPELRKRMQGKSCFNFTTIDRERARELSDLTRAGIARLAEIELPWAQPAKGAKGDTRRRK
jgi:hypothetical protein